MSVHSHSTASHESAAAPEFPRHVVTAVLVAHDGARWLPQALAGLLGQERPVQHWVAADTGSSDDSARLLAEALGDDRVVHLARRTGFGAAVDEAARTAPVLTPEDLPYLKRPSGWDPVSRTWRDDAYDLPELPHGEPVQWLWLLHDDCAPEPDALAELLRVAEASPQAGVIGPKLRGWYDTKQLLEVGVSIARSGRRWTGLDRREQDQGQHDQVRPVLSVSTAGMLVRRDVYEELGGFDRRLPLMRDDVDLCWRAHAAGHTVLVAPDAVLRHAEAAARERRTVDCAGRTAANPHRVDKAGAVHTLLVNTPAPALPYVLLRLLLGTVLRTLGYLVGKAPGQAVDEAGGLVRTLLRPERILTARRRRGRPAVPAKELRPLFPPPGATLRATVEQLAGHLGDGRDTETATAGRHGGAVESGPGGDDADFLEIEQFARLRRIARRPAPVLFALLLAVSLTACRGLLAGGSLTGGALLPAPGGAGALWSAYLGEWHAVGTGGTDGAPPYLAVLAALSSLLLGSTQTALTVLLVCSVPLAGLTAYFASRPLVESRLLRAWTAVAYAFLPAVTGALAGGRLGTAVLAVLLPLMARAAVAAYGFGGDDTAKGSWRATWTFTLLLTLATAFTPVAWPLAVLLGLAALGLHRSALKAYAPRFLATAAVPLLVLAPWSLTLLTDPAAFLREAGLPYGEGSASALDLLGISPGGPKAAGGLLLAGIVLAALAALLRGERQFAIRAAWATALAGLVFAVLLNHSGWAGPATLVYGAALIAAAALGADGARERVAAQSFGWRQPVAALIALGAVAGPLLAAAGWTITGADGPLERRDPVQVPAFVAEMSGSRDQPRTLVLVGDSPAKVSYTLVRGSGGRIGDAEFTAAHGTDARLDKVVAGLVAGSGADQSDELGAYAIRYVLLKDGAPHQMGRVLNATPGLSRLSKLDGISLWEVKGQVARAVIRPARAGEDPIPVAAGAVEAHTDLPAGDPGRILRIADSAAPGWQATLNGKPLPGKTVDGWAQGFELPATAGRLDLTYEDSAATTARHWAQGSLALVLLVMALPGRRRRLDDDLPEEEAAVPAQADGEGRRARRLRAGTTDTADAQADPYAVPTGGDDGTYPPYTAVPAQPDHGQWDTPAYAPAADPHTGYDTAYDTSYDTSYDSAYGTAYDTGHDPSAGGSYGTGPGYDPQPAPYDGHAPGVPPQAAPYGGHGYEPHPQGGPYQARPYDPYDDPYGQDDRRPDGSNQQ
ncbi:glycosyltransferase family 2 protein [Streptomyces bambusae]|uniref:glycosyltransferase family 2 protein n=1 Tax=Streptomyces bambusae TaxID=1550616 RepID=UPI001CFF210B|nr:glycosyltransferase family 2 protein [Streptomyces bambusae]MCB5166331.1 glycosyltransferase family 2 protein [Streptomyces bambusae]